MIDHPYYQVNQNNNWYNIVVVRLRTMAYLQQNTQNTKKDAAN